MPDYRLIHAVAAVRPVPHSESVVSGWWLMWCQLQAVSTESNADTHQGKDRCVFLACY